MRLLHLLLAAALLSLAATLPSAAQDAAPPRADTTSARIVGATLRGQSPVVGARVVLRALASGDVTTARSGADGRFELRALRPGSYLISASSDVGRTQGERRLVLTPAARLDVVLTLSDSSQSLSTVAVVGQKRRTSTVTKTPVPLEDLPISVQVVGPELMQEQQAIDLREVVRNVSGVTPTGTYNGGYVYYNSRGFNMNNWSNFRRNGMMVWNMGHHFNDNIEQVEILKGPASIQYGDVAPGGIMNFVTKQPTATAFRRLETKFGQYGLVRPTVDLNQPLNASGTLLSRLNATYEQSDSFRDEVESEAVMVAPTLAWRPNERFSWTVEGTYKRDDRVGDPGIISPTGSFDGLSNVPVSRFLGEPNARYEFEDLGLYSTLSFALKPAWRLQQVSYYSDTYRIPNNIYLESTAADANGLVPRSQYSFRQWFRGGGASLDLIGDVVTRGLQHRVVLGVDHMFNASRFTNGIDEMLDRAISIDAPRYGEATLQADPLEWNNSRFFYQRTGVYVQDQVGMLNDRVQLLLGARFNVTSTGNKYDSAADAPDAPTESEDRVFSPRLGLVVKPRPWLSLYGSFAESYEMNGQDWIDPTITIAPTDARQFEIGSKASLLNDRLGVTLSLFQLEKENIYSWIDAVTRPTIPFVSWDSAGAWATYQGGTHRSRGIELDVNGRVLDDALTINAAASLVDATVVQDPAFAAGNRLEGNARTIANVWLNYVIPASVSPFLAGFEVGAGAFHRGRFHATTANDPDQLVDSFQSMDIALGYRFRNVRARLNLSNVTNAIGYTSSFGVYEPLWVRRAVFSLSTTF